MHLVATFVPGRKLKTYCIAFLLPDCKTSYGRRLIVPGEDQLLKVVGKLNGDVEELRHKLETWGQGSVHVYPSPAQMEWIGNRKARRAVGG